MERWLAKKTTILILDGIGPFWELEVEKSLESIHEIDSGFAYLSSRNTHIRVVFIV